MLYNFGIQENTCIKLGVNGKTKSVIYNWKWGRGRRIKAITINIVWWESSAR
jgi:hypothetical protein